MRRALTVALLGALALLNVPATALAQSDSGEIRIVVTDAATKKPVGLARVLLDGPVIASELTSDNGRVNFTDVPDGIYRARILHPGYQGFSSPSFEVIEGRAITVSFAIAPVSSSGLQVIGHVAVKASATVSSSSITQNSAQRRLSDDLAGALNKLSGVSISTSSDDSDATQTISLEGHDPSQTQMTLDGIPLNAPGTAGNLGMFATDLFMGASVHMGPSMGGLGGSVNFSTLQPTLSWLSQGQLSGGSNGRYNYSLAESGSFGKLGLAVQNVYRLVPSLADGDVYLDASGQTYSHLGDSSIDGNLMALRYQFNDFETLSGTFLSSARTTDLACLRIENPPALPCGYGPNNSDDSSISLYSLTDNALIGATQLQASVFRSTTTNLFNGLNETVAVGVVPYVIASPSPIGFSGLTQTQGFSLNATLPAKERHTISLQAYGVSSTQATTPLIAAAQPFYNGSLQTGYAAVQASDAIHSNDHLSLDESLGVSSASGGGAGVLASTGVVWNPTRNDSFSASYALSGAAPTIGRLRILSSPTQLRFDCNGNVAYGQAPGQNPGRSSSSSVRVGYTRTLRGGNISLTLYRQLQDGVLLPLYVNGSLLASQLPAGYLTTVAQVYDSPAGCNEKPATPFGAQQLYFQSPVGGVQRVYQGGELTGYATLGRLVVQPYYNVTVAQANSTSPLFVNPYSFTISGAQLPNVPLQKAGVVFDYKAPRSALEWLADAQYTARNNPNNLPAYTTFDAGVTAQLATGTLTLAASNVTNAYAGVFAGPANAVPYTTLGGYVIGTTARPLMPRTYAVTYSVKFGQGATTTQTASTFTPRRNGPYGFGGPERPGGPGGPGGPRGGMHRMFSPLPGTPPPDPLAVTADPQTCSADAAGQARLLSAQLTAYVARIEAAKTPRGYPAAFPAPAIPGMTVVYHGLGTTYALAMTPKSFGLFRPLIGCMSVHIARADDVTARKLYAAPTTLFFVPQLNFMPSVGLYLVARRPQPGQEQFRMYQLPSKAPAAPFALQTVPSCSAQARGIAAPALAELQAYFANGTKPASWTIVAHAAKSGSWYELTPGDVTILPALLACGRVAATNGPALAARGFDGSAIPALNYAAPLGLYLVRPQRPRPSPNPRS